MPQPIVIKKYENRRLYDTTNSRYVNLDDIAQMVRDGLEVRVVDAASGEDLTRLVLTQIIVESAKTSDSAFPLDMLRQMIMSSGRMSQQGMEAYMKTMMDMYQNTYRAFSPLGFMAPKPPEPAQAKSTHAQPEGDSTVDDLRQRLEELERKLRERNSKRSSTKRARQ